jgi:hypothetical protein
MNKAIREFLIRIGYTRKADFMIIGAQKGGTSALFEILEKHPFILGASKKEVHYFDNDEWYTQGKIHEYNQHFYLPHEIPLRAKVFEATPIYIFHPEIAQRLWKYNPDLRLIVSLREPASRAFSAWTMYHHHFAEGKYSFLHDPRSFSQAVADEMKVLETESFWDNKIAYVKRGFYARQIKQYLNFFPKDQMLFIESSEVRESFDSVSKEIQDFIGVPHHDLVKKESNLRQVDDQIKYAETISELRAFYQPYNEELYELIEKRFDW